MKGIDTLIRLAKRDLDELKKKQVALETEKAKLEQAIVNLEQQLKNEEELARKTQEMASFYGGFAKRIRERQAQLREEIYKVEQALVQLSEAIMNAFADLKKYEIARDNAKARKKAEEARKETLMLDEIAGNQFARKEREEQ